MQSKKMYLILIICSFLNISFSHADILKEIRVMGNTKSKTSVVKRYVHKKIGEDLAVEDIKAIQERLLKLHQIRLEKIDFKDGILLIEVTDKWSLFPVPMITQSGDYYSRGILIYENNFLGAHGTMATAFAWTNSGFNGLLYFQDESLVNENIGFKALLLRKADLIEFERHNGIVSRFESRYDTFIFTPNYLSDNQVYKIGPILINKSIVDDSGNEIYKRSAYGLFGRHHYQKYQVTDTQYEGLITTLNTTFARDDTSKSILLIEGDVKTSYAIDENYINFTMQGHYSTDSSYLYSKLIGGNEGNRGYDKQSVPTKNNLSGMIQWQQYLFYRTFVAPFYEYNIITLIDPILDGRTIKENSVGLSLRYFFKKISIPAVLVEYAHNIEDNSEHFHLNIGLSI